MTAMKPAELERLCRPLFGSRWRHGLAAALGRSHVSVKMWHAGGRPIPADIAERIRAMAADPVAAGIEPAASALIADIERICGQSYSGRRRVARILARIAEYRGVDPP